MSAEELAQRIRTALGPLDDPDQPVVILVAALRYLAERLRNRVAELEADERRLDWLLGNNAGFLTIGDAIGIQSVFAYRDEIDAAMAGEKP